MTDKRKAHAYSYYIPVVIILHYDTPPCTIAFCGVVEADVNLPSHKLVVAGEFERGFVRTISGEPGSAYGAVSGPTLKCAGQAVFLAVQKPPTALPGSACVSRKPFQ